MQSTKEGSYQNAYYSLELLHRQAELRAIFGDEEHTYAELTLPCRDKSAQRTKRATIDNL